MNVEDQRQALKVIAETRNSDVIRCVGCCVVKVIRANISWKGLFCKRAKQSQVQGVAR